MSAQGCYPGYAGDPTPPCWQQPFHYPPYLPTYWYAPVTGTADATGCTPLQTLTEQRIREIIREELRAALADKEPTP